MRETKAKFVLIGKPTDKTKQIYLRMIYKGSKKTFYTGQRVNPNDWSLEFQRVKQGAKFNKTINEHLDKISDLANNTFNQSLGNGSQTCLIDVMTALKEKFKPQQLKPKVELPKIEFWNLYDEVVNDSQIAERSLSKRTIDKYIVIQKRLKKFEKLKKYPLTFESITHAFYSKFLKYLQEQQLAPSTVGNHVKTIKAIMNEGLRLKLHSNLDFQTFRKPKVQDAVTVALTLDEVRTLEQMDLTDNKRLEKVRDLFIFGIWSYQRISDFATIGADQLQKDCFVIIQEKTKVKRTISYEPIQVQILEKYNYNLKQLYHSKVNDYLKELCKLAGFDTKVIVPITKGKKTEKKTFEKWQLVASHTARRTGLTLLYLKTKDAITCMQLSGHKTEKAFLKYIRFEQNVAIANYTATEKPKETNLKKVS